MVYLLISVLLLGLLFAALKIRNLKAQKKSIDQLNAIQTRQLSQLETSLSEKEESCLKLQEQLLHLKSYKAAELESLRHFRDLVEETEEFLFELDTQGRFLYTNPIMQRRLGYEEAELKDRHFYSFLLPEKTAEIEAFYKEQYTSRTRGTYAEWEALNRFGEPLFIGIRVNMTFSPDGKLESIMGSARDLSIQQALRKKNELFEERLEPFFQGIEAPVLFVDKAKKQEDYFIHWANNAFGKLLELDRHRIQTMRLGQISLVLRELVSEKCKSPERRVLWQPKPDKNVWFKVLAWDGGDVLGIFLENVSIDEAQRQKEAMQQEILVSALNAMDAEFGLLDPEERYVFSNQVFTQRTLQSQEAIGKSEEERAKSSGQNLERALFWKSKLDEVKLTGSKIRFEELVETSDSLIRMVLRDLLPFPWPNTQQSGFLFLGQDISSRQALQNQQLEARDRLYFYWRSQYSTDQNVVDPGLSEDVCLAYFGEPMAPGSPLDCFGEIRFVHYFPYTSEQLYDFQRVVESSLKQPFQVQHPASYAESGVFYFPSVLISETIQYLTKREISLNAEIRFSGAMEADSFFQFILTGFSTSFLETEEGTGIKFLLSIWKECGFSVTSNPESIVFQGRILWANKPDPGRLNLPIPILKGKRIITGPSSQRKVSFYMEELSLHGAEIHGIKSIYGINKLIEEVDFQLFVWWGDIENDWKEVDQHMLQTKGIQVLVYSDPVDSPLSPTPYIVKAPPASLKIAVEDAWRYSGSGKSARLNPGGKKSILLRFEKVLEITEGDKGFMRSLFDSYYVSLEECQVSFEKHLFQKDAEALKFLLHKVRATIKTFEIRELDALLREAIEAVESQSLRNSADRTRLVEQMAWICQEAKASLTAFARTQGIDLQGLA